MSGIQRDPANAKSVAGISGMAIAANVRACPIWSIRKPESSGPVKLAEANPRLTQLKLRERSEGAAMAPANVCVASWKNMNETPSRHTVMYSTGNDGQTKG